VEDYENVKNTTRRDFMGPRGREGLGVLFDSIREAEL